jgi:nucleoside-diphosphate-sugar epimerase
LNERKDDSAPRSGTGRLNRVLVTGASGFIGRALCRRLLAERATVLGTARGKCSDPSLEGVTWIRGDLADVQFARRLLADTRPELVVHLAGEVTGSRAIDAVAPTFTGSLQATVNLLTALAEIGCERAVLVGSGDEPRSGEVPSSPYAAAKAGATGYARMFHTLYALPIAVARPFMVYGPDDSDLSALVPHVITSVRRGRGPRLTTGRRRCDWVYKDDVVEALVTIGRSPACEGQQLDIGSGSLHTVREVAETIIRLTGSVVTPEWGAIPDRPGEPEHVADITTTRRICGWSPATDLVTGLQRTIEWYATAVR